MNTKKISKSSEATRKCFREAVYNELKKKALLGQYAIIHCDGKTCRVPAQEALEIAQTNDNREAKAERLPDRSDLPKFGTDPGALPDEV